MPVAASEPGQGFELRRHNFGRQIYFYAPGLKRYQTAEFHPREPQGFVGVSITGQECSLQCDHCQGKLLQSMWPAQGRGELFALCQRLVAMGTRGVLISGGSDPRGRVPLLERFEEIRRIKEELPLSVLVHTGLVDRELALALKTAAIDGAMIDIIGSDETIRGVCHLQATTAEYEESLASLTQAGVPTMPHIVLGLDHGRLVGEEVALDMAARYPVSVLVVVVLTPLAGTPMDEVAPPGEREIGCFLEKARALLPRTPLVLGCARPAGERKAAIDRWAIRAGVNGIAYPAEGTVRYARRMGLEPRFYETCCALVPQEAVVSS
ncbi:MAG: radical SAM protein [Chloroflexota bacterium]|nr:radical SAM protein [Chloroflexota bacterium]